METAAPAPVKTRGRPSKRGIKRQALLDGAAALFNARGISGTNLADIAERLGLSRATVYYYVSDRAELVFHCYLRTCELTAEDLAAANQAANGLQRILEFIRRAFTPSREPTAVLSEINSLNSEHAIIVRRENDRNIRTLIGFISEGVQDGSIRNCDCEVAAQAIVGMLSWSQLLPQWSRSKYGEALRARASAAIIDLLMGGLARSRKAKFSCRIDAESFQPTLVNAFDRKESSSLKIAHVLAAASRQFNRNGIEATSLDQIAAALGVTKGVLYHYWNDKSDLITSCYERAFVLYEKFVEVALTTGNNGLESALINAHLNIQAQAGSLSPLMPQPGFESVPDEQRAPLVRRANQENKAMAELLRRGIAEGVGRSCDAPLVTHICAGAFGWLPKWLPDDNKRSPMEMGDEICLLLLKGLRAA